MVAVEVSGSFIVRESKILMIEEEEGWNIPTSEGEIGELSADTAERAVEECTGCDSNVVKYRKELKHEFVMEQETYRLQPYIVEIEGEPENAEWKRVSELESEELASPIEKVEEKIVERF